MFPKKFLNQNIRIIKGKIYTASNYRDSEVVNMADVAITFSVLPEESDSDLNQMSEKIKGSLKDQCRICGELS